LSAFQKSNLQLIKYLVLRGRFNFELCRNAKQNTVNPGTQPHALRSVNKIFSLNIIILSVENNHAIRLVLYSLMIIATVDMKSVHVIITVSLYNYSIMVVFL